jgi:hypothetical protein
MDLVFRQNRKKKKPPPTEIKLSNSISLLLGKDNKIFWHQQDNTSLMIRILMKLLLIEKELEK